MSVFRIAIRIVWSFGSGSIGFRILDVVGFFGSGSGFSFLRFLDLVWFSGIWILVFGFLRFGFWFGFSGSGFVSLLVQRCKIRGDVKTFFDQYSVLPDERKICPMNVGRWGNYRIFSLAASSSLCPFPTGMAFPCTYIVLPRISSILLILMI